jgi:hypothetical protein
MEVDMYDPLFDIINERQSQIRAEIETNRKLADLQEDTRGVRQMVAYSLGGMLISFGMRLREGAVNPSASTVSAGPYRMSEECR